MSRRESVSRVSAERAAADIEAQFLASAAPTVVDRFALAPREAAFAPVPPPYLEHPRLGDFINSEQLDGAVWRHQALALEHAANGDNVLVTTGTGSGKSLTFQWPVLRELLYNDGTALILYPQRALGSDQLRRWCRAIDGIGESVGLVGMINGGTPMAERARIMHEARVVLATPDVVHAWLARLQSEPTNARFIRRLKFIVIDEAHAFDGVFGSNSAYLLRRLRAAAKLAGRETGIQFLAASATMANPTLHLEALTGLSFKHVSEADNGSPAQGLVLLHVEGPTGGRSAEAYLAELVEQMRQSDLEGSFVAFLDSRQGVERVARQVADEQILPYRSGYADFDRRSIEQALLSGSLKGCISTSALELGIDVASFRTGINLGLPMTRKAFRQRAGRVGRGSSGLFVVVAPGAAFAKLGTSLEEFFCEDVEQSRIYLENEIIQFQQACCLAAETDPLSALEAIDWPTGFDLAVERARGSRRRPRNIGSIAPPAQASPHHHFPLRQIADERLMLRAVGNSTEDLGEIGLEKAIREAYPGATYLHMKQAYRVVDWRTCGSERTIHLDPVRAGPSTTPMLASRVELGTALGGTILSGPGGSLAEIGLNIVETVYGYAIGKKAFLYSELAAGDGRSRARYRRFSTTGVALRIDEPWFAGEADAQVSLRKQVAEAFRTILQVDAGILPGELATAHTSIWAHHAGSRAAARDTIVVFDDLQGGLRLTSRIAAHFSEILDRLRVGAERAGVDSLLDLEIIDRLASWHAALVPSKPERHAEATQILAPGTPVEVLLGGTALATTITGHQVMHVSGHDLLMYSYELENGLGWVSHDAVHLFDPQAPVLSSTRHETLGEGEQ